MLGALGLMRSNPKFKFALDQTCFIEPFLKTYPEERAFFQQMIDQGRMEITCGMYSMPDVNIPSGESFIRQVLEGKGYSEREMGVDPRCGWTIDTFGHHPQFPQLMAKCGFDHAAFQRLMVKGSPSEFLWEGFRRHAPAVPLDAAQLRPVLPARRATRMSLQKFARERFSGVGGACGHSAPAGDGRRRPSPSTRTCPSR